MSFRYRCEPCRMTSLDVSSRAAAEDLRTLHRTATHSAQAPVGGDEIEGEEDRPEGGWRTVVAFVALLVIGAVALVARWLRHLL